MRRSLFFSFFVLAVACGPTPPANNQTSVSPIGSAAPSATAARPISSDLPEAPRDGRERILADAAGSLLTRQHVLARPIDDAVSKEAFQRFIEELDSAKLFLLESDVKKLALFELQMDDELRAGDLSLGRKGVALLASRRRTVTDVIAKTLATPLDFTANESIETDPKKRAFCKNEEELAARWRGVLKLQVLERTQQLEETLEKKTNPKKDAKTKA